MIVEFSNLVIVLSPLLWLLYILSLVFMVLEELYDVKGIFRFISYGLCVVFICVSFMSGCKYQELILFLLVWIVIQAISISLHNKKDGAKEL
ncbi:MAG: hypothetical protein WCR67_00280 [Bacilli bacterium]